MTKENPFKVGDRVRVLQDRDWVYRFKEGDEFIVTNLKSYFGVYLNDDDDEDWANIDRFELVRPAPNPLEEAAKLLRDNGYSVVEPPKPLTGKVVIFTTLGTTDSVWSVSLDMWESNYKPSFSYKLLAILDWVEGQGIAKEN